ncbi:MAG: DUF5106 domain-containing protein [Muribaculaceae bacterium]|nr:DUF5106 domain-containing protein [Muribaculaceae bacterium]
MKKITLFAAVALMAHLSALAQDEPLFAYPVAPDTCSTLESRCDFIVTSFWDNYDLTKPIKDEARFTKAFEDYVDFFKYADKPIVLAAIREFMFKARANATNFAKIGALAEQTLYGENAVYWSDEAYLPFAEAMAENKQMKKDVRSYYSAQVEKIKKNVLGAPMPLVEWTDVNGTRHKLSEVKASDIVIVLLTDGGMDSDMARLRLSTDVVLNDMISQGEVAVVDITLGRNDGAWTSRAKSFPENWQVGANNDIGKVLDIRYLPSAYVVDAQGKILNKNVSVEAIKRAFTN